MCHNFATITFYCFSAFPQAAFDSLQIAENKNLKALQRSKRDLFDLLGEVAEAVSDVVSGVADTVVSDVADASNATADVVADIVDGDSAEADVTTTSSSVAVSGDSTEKTAEEEATTISSNDDSSDNSAEKEATTDLANENSTESSSSTTDLANLDSTESSSSSDFDLIGSILSGLGDTVSTVATGVDDAISAVVTGVTSAVSDGESASENSSNLLEVVSGVIETVAAAAAIIIAVFNAANLVTILAFWAEIVFKLISAVLNLSSGNILEAASNFTSVFAAIFSYSS